MERLRLWAGRVKRDLIAVASAARDPRTPWLARLLAVAVVAYALSPIDLTPAALPISGLLDDLLLGPLGLWLVIRLIPAAVLDQHRRSSEGKARLPHSRAAGAVIVLLWIVTVGAGLMWLL